MKNKEIKILINKGTEIKIKHIKEIERFNFLGMSLMVCKSENYSNHIALIEQTTGHLAYETNCKTAKECLQKFKAKCKHTGLTKHKVKKVIDEKITELKKMGFKIPINQ